MTPPGIFAILLTLSVLFGVLNERTLRLPNTIGFCSLRCWRSGCSEWPACGSRFHGPGGAAGLVRRAGAILAPIIVQGLTIKRVVRRFHP